MLRKKGAVFVEKEGRSFRRIACREGCKKLAGGRKQKAQEGKEEWGRNEREDFTLSLEVGKNEKQNSFEKRKNLLKGEASSLTEQKGGVNRAKNKKGR